MTDMENKMTDMTKDNAKDATVPRKKGSAVKNKMNIVCRGYVKENKAGGEIIAVVPDVPVSAYLDDLLFILTVPNEEQSYAPAYIRLQDKESYGAAPAKGEEVKAFTSDIRVAGYLKQKKGEIIVIAPKTHVRVDLDKIVVIATIPAEDKDRAPCYIKPKAYKFETKRKDIDLSSSEDMIDDSGESIDIDSINIGDVGTMNN